MLIVVIVSSSSNWVLFVRDLSEHQSAAVIYDQFMIFQAEFSNDPGIDRIRPLRCFLAVAEHLHFGHAAQALVLPQSTVSAEVKQLERALGGDLFTRTSRRVRLTPLGDSFRPDAERALATLHDAIASARSMVTSGHVPLLLGTAYLVDDGELACALPALRAQFPDIQVVPQVLRTADQLDALADRRLHLGFAWEHGTDHNVVSHEVGRSGLVAFVPYNHPFADRDSLDVSELAGHPLVVWSRHLNTWSRDRLDRMCADAGFIPNIIAEPDSFEGQVTHVLAGSGIGLSADSIARRQHIPALVLVPVSTADVFRRYLIHRPGEDHPAVQPLVDIIRDVAAAQNESRTAGAT
jgi:DNA-binding transcriptional LysR family regulator